MQSVTNSSIEARRDDALRRAKSLRIAALEAAAEARFLERAHGRSASECWRWPGKLNDSGYGVLSVAYGNALAHRYSYELFVGPIPDGLVIDHLCRVRECFNPTHLEPVTPAENIARGEALEKAAEWRANRTHCRNGHEYNETNTHTWRGKRMCRPCLAGQKRRNYQRKKERSE